MNENSTRIIFRWLFLKVLQSEMKKQNIKYK